MYKTDLIRRVARDTRLSQRAVADVVTSSVQFMQEALRDGQVVQLPGFGTFYTRERQESTVRHIQTGKPIRVSARQVVGFRTGELLKRAVARGPRRRD